MTQAHPPEQDQGLSMRQLTHLVYGLFGLGLISFGIFVVATIAAMVVIYLKRGDAAGTLYASHFDWLITTFWWGALWLLLSFIASYVFVGWITGLVALIWVVYRVAKGWLALCAGQAPSAD